LVIPQPKNKRFRPDSLAYHRKPSISLRCIEATSGLFDDQGRKNNLDHSSNKKYALMMNDCLVFHRNSSISVRCLKAMPGFSNDK